jgi:membrane protein
MRTLDEWLEADVMHWGAALSYYTLLSLGPVLLLLTSAAGTLVGTAEAQAEIVSQLTIVLGPRGADVAEALLDETSFPGLGSWSSLVSLLVLLIAATAVFSNVQGALNEVWRVKALSGTILNALRTRMIAFLMILVLGGLVLFFVLFTTAAALMLPVVEARVPWAPTLLRIADPIVSVIVLWIAFAAVYRVLPDVVIQWRDVIVGALVTAILFTLGKGVLGPFLARTNVTSMFGAAGSVFGLMVWVYYSAQVFLIGASFTRVWAEARGREILPETYAGRVNVLIDDEPTAEV